MNVVEISENEALNSGAELWVIKNDSSNKWWQELDFRSGFLLSQCLYHHRKQLNPKVNEILEVTQFPKAEYFEETKNLLVGTSDHFLNKWILVWQDDSDKVDDFVEKISQRLKFKSVRIFSDSDSLIKKFKARQKSSLDDVTFIKNT